MKQWLLLCRFAVFCASWNFNDSINFLSDYVRLYSTSELFCGGLCVWFNLSLFVVCVFILKSYCFPLGACEWKQKHTQR